MFKRNFKSLVSVVMSVLTLSAFCQPIKAMDTDRALDTSKLMWGSDRFLTTDELFKNSVCEYKGLESVSVKPINIQNMSAVEIRKYLNEQITKFESLGDGDTFVVDNNVKIRSNPKLLALVMKGLNEVFGKYPILVDYMMCVKSKFPQIFKKFRISFLNRSVPNYNEVVARYLVDRGIEFNENLMRSSVFDVMSFGLKQVRTGFHSELHPKMLVEAAVAHEMGHLIDSIICDKNSKCEIIKLAKSENMNLSSTKISKLGERNDQEWFAEVFAHLMYGKNQNDLSNAMGGYLREEFKMLKKSIR